MIRVGIGKPVLKFMPGYNDMSHYFPGRWEVNNYFIMSVDDYMEKREFDQFNMKPDLPKGSVQNIIEKVVYDKKEIKYEETFLDPGLAYAYNMKQQINKAGGSTLWQFNAISPNLDGHIRYVICLGENKLRLWSWYDANVKLPLLKRKARLLNYLRRHKAQKEWDDWEKYLEEIK